MNAGPLMGTIDMDTNPGSTAMHVSGVRNPSELYPRHEDARFIVTIRNGK